MGPVHTAAKVTVSISKEGYAFTAVPGTLNFTAARRGSITVLLSTVAGAPVEVPWQCVINGVSIYFRF